MKYIATWTTKHSANIEAKDVEEAEEKFSSGDFTNEYGDTVEWDIEKSCAFCGNAEDDDGRCGCTNSDAR